MAHAHEHASRTRGVQIARGLAAAALTIGVVGAATVAVRAVGGPQGLIRAATDAAARCPTETAYALAVGPFDGLAREAQAEVRAGFARAHRRIAAPC